MKVVGLAAAAVMALCSSAFAETIYDCSLRANDQFGWVGDRAIFWLDPQKGTAQVLDAVGNHVNGGPGPATLDIRSNGNYVIKWGYEKVPAARGSVVRVKYTAVMRPKQGRVRIDAVLPSADNTSSGSGKCKIVQQ